MNIMEMMKKAQTLQADMQKLKDEIDQQEFHGDAGGGMVKVTMAGDGRVLSTKIDPAAFVASEKEIVQDLVVAAVNQANRARKDYRAEKLQSMTAGLPIPPGMMGMT